MGDWVPSIGHCVYHQGRCSFFFYLQQIVYWSNCSPAVWPRVRTICWSVRTICWSVVRCDSPFHLTLFTEPSPASSHLASTVSPTTQSASVPASIIGYSTSSSSISVQSLWETESLQLDTVSTIKEDVVSSSIYLATGKNNLLISKNNLLISCSIGVIGQSVFLLLSYFVHRTVWQSVSSYFVLYRTVLRLAILPAQCPQLHNQRVFQPASLATAQAPAVFLFNHCGRLSPFNWTLCLPSRKM